VLDNIAEKSRDVRAVVISSAIPKIFTAGIDRDWLVHLIA